MGQKESDFLNLNLALILVDIGLADHHDQVCDGVIVVLHVFEVYLLFQILFANLALESEESYLVRSQTLQPDTEQGRFLMAGIQSLEVVGWDLFIVFSDSETQYTLFL